MPEVAFLEETLAWRCFGKIGSVLFPKIGNPLEFSLYGYLSVHATCVEHALYIAAFVCRVGCAYVSRTEYDCRESEHTGRGNSVCTGPHVEKDRL